jgi:LysR family glycine cleavage system transcriptional activator
VQTRRNVLPPLDYLLAFEAAAKHQSFVGASRDLNISETAISRKVRLLEQHYNCPLFHRGHRSISLTHVGQSFLDKILPALMLLRDASQDLMANQNERTVTLAATNSVAALWLMPRLPLFRAANEHVEINIVASDNDAECLGESNDLSILRGDGQWPGYVSSRLFGETIFPVCSPAYLSDNPGAAQAETLHGLDLIEVSSGHKEWMNWRTWLDLVRSDKAPIKRAAIFNTYPLSIQAAMDGLGIALGWGHLVDHLLGAGALVRPVPDINVRTEFGYYLLRPENEAPFSERQIVEDWLTEISAARTRYRR